MTAEQRVSDEMRSKSWSELSRRHRRWGSDCPAVDADFVLAEYNHGVTVAIFDYKHHLGGIAPATHPNNRVLAGLYDSNGNNLPFFIARYWPDTWAFKVRGMNEPARVWLKTNEEVPYTEQRFVAMLYRLRKAALSRQDEQIIRRLNVIDPPSENYSPEPDRLPL